MTRHLILMLLMLMLTATHLFAIDDTRALEGLKEAPVIYDVRTDSPQTLLFIFKVIADTREGMLNQGVGGDVIVSMRGPTVKMLVANNQTGDAETRKKLAETLEKLQRQGVRLEACSYALDLFALDPGDLSPGVTAVGNSIVSLIAYQAKGYALVSMN